MSKRKGKGQNFVPRVLLYLKNTLTDVVEALECCDRGWLFLGKEERSKNEELNLSLIHI